MKINNIKIAIIHDWLTTYAGAEKVLEQIINIYPKADLFSVVDFIDNDKRSWLKGKRAKTTFIQKMPFSKYKYRAYLPLMPIAIEQHDLSAYDLIISSSHAVAKGVLTGPNQLHICYCHSPIRYAWDLQHQYLNESNMSSGIKSLLSRYILHKMRIWDYRTANGVDFFVSNSKFISRRIKKIYGKNSTVIYPPINTENYYFEETSDKEFYVTCSRLVQYKKIDLIVDTFTKKFPNKDLLIIGDGPEFKKIKSKAGSNVKLVGKKSDSYLRRKLSGAKAFIFAAEEDFGIVPLEAQSCGTPVIAYGKGGALETVIGLDREDPTGVFFKYQSIESLEDAVLRFEKKSHLFKRENCIKNAKRFNSERFRNEFKHYVDSKLLDLQ